MTPIPATPIASRIPVLLAVFGWLLATGGVARADSHPFASHRQPHAAGILELGVGTAAADAATAAHYRHWKQRYLVPGCDAGDYRVKAGTAQAHTVSEGQGYGMLITVMMAGHDPEARMLFDGLHRYNRRHPSDGDPALLAWAQGADCRNVAGASSATDGDLDIAYALLLADLQWGSDGGIAYADEARRVLAAICRRNVHLSSRLLNLGDWVRADSPKYGAATRSSDWMVGHFRAFASRHDECDWAAIAQAHQALIARMQHGFAPDTGLLPDFVVDSDTDPRPAPPHFLEAATDGDYAWNAGRVPWRIGLDAALSGDARSREAALRLSRWIRVQSGGDPARIRAGYRLDGRALSDGHAIFFVAPFAVAALVDPEAQAWLDALWAHLDGTGPTDYYGDSVRLLSMLAVSRNWLQP